MLQKLREITSQRIALNDEWLDLSLNETIPVLISHLDSQPNHRDCTLVLGLTFLAQGDIENGASVLVCLVDRLIFQGRILEAIFILHQGLGLQPEAEALTERLKKIHKITQELKEGAFEATRPVAGPAPAVFDEIVFSGLSVEQQRDYGTQLVLSADCLGDPSIPLPVPLLSELKEGIFLMMVSLLQYNRVAKGESILEEGVRQESIIIVVSGHVEVSRKGQHLAKVGPGIVLGESGILTRDTLPVSAIAHEEAEYFELTRLAVRDMARANTKVVTQLQESFGKQIRGNILNTASLFQLFEDFAQYLLIDQFEFVHFDPGEVIVDSSETLAPLYLIASGSVEMQAQNEGGAAISFACESFNGVLGAQSHPYQTSPAVRAVARSRVTLLRLSVEKCKTEINQHSRVVEYLTELGKKRVIEGAAILSGD